MLKTFELINLVILEKFPLLLILKKYLSREIRLHFENPRKFNYIPKSHSKLNKKLSGELFPHLLKCSVFPLLATMNIFAVKIAATLYLSAANIRNLSN